MLKETYKIHWQFENEEDKIKIVMLSLWAESQPLGHQVQWNLRKTYSAGYVHPQQFLFSITLA